MSKLLWVVLVAGLLACSACNAEPLVKGPNLGFDHQAVIKEHMQLVAEGKADKAIEVLAKHANSAETFGEDFKTVMRKRIATIHGSAGTCLDHELVGYKQVTSRILRFYSVTHFDKFAVTYMFLFYKGPDGQWKLLVYSVADGVDELEKVTPFTSIVITR